MLTNRQLFLQHLAPTSDEPLMLEIVSAAGCEMHTADNKVLIDLISGISVSSVGHCHPDVVSAVQEQASRYMHLMVYGEIIQAPQVQFAAALTALLPPSLNSCYLVNSGSEAVEGAMKLAKRVTGRHEIIAFENAYHGSTQGALSIIGSEYFRNSFRPLLPGIKHLQFNNEDSLNSITENTACVVTEIIQGEAGAVSPKENYLAKLQSRCHETGTLLVVDEIQSGFRRTGPFMAFMDEGIIPDILLLAKGIGGGMPLGAIVAGNHLMQQFTNNPVLGHITTFGGHPVSCAAALATLNILKDISEAEIIRKSELFREKLVHPFVREVTGKGLLLGVDLGTERFNKEVIKRCIANGVFTDWFLFAPHKMRIAPPLIISDHQIFICCEVILKAVDEVAALMKQESSVT
ncbi:MAG: aspartate aminotransferase family protein [Bacteroidetes bacterium]|nr:aspartate aminotransferase family protein [Bacteroidota bacterium]